MQFSIIVSVYKAEKYIHSCIESILTQQCKDFELLLIDDGSPDKSGEICDDYARADKRIRVFHQQNKGVSAARNTGLDNATGRYILFVDADDMLYPNALSVLKQKLDTSDVNIDLVQFSLNNEYNIYETDDKFSDILNSIDYVQAGTMNVCIGGSLFNNDIIKINHLQFNEQIKYAEDQLFIFDYLKYSKSNIRINDVLYFYRINNSSAVRNMNSEDVIKSIKTLDDYKRTNGLSEILLSKQILGFIYYLAIKSEVSITEIRSLYVNININITNCIIRTKGVMLFYKIAVFSPSLAIIITRLYGRITK